MLESVNHIVGTCSTIFHKLLSVALSEWVLNTAFLHIYSTVLETGWKTPYLQEFALEYSRRKTSEDSAHCLAPLSLLNESKTSRALY